MFCSYIALLKNVENCIKVDSSLTATQWSNYAPHRMHSPPDQSMSKKQTPHFCIYSWHALFDLPSYIGRWRHTIRTFAVVIFHNVKKSATELCEILCIVTIYIVINSTHIHQHMHVRISCLRGDAFDSNSLCTYFLFWQINVFIPSSFQFKDFS